MKQYRLIILLAFLFIASSQVSMAQFRVMASSGKPTSTINKRPAKVGAPVSPGATIIVSPKSYLSLLHPKTRGTVEISKAGTYNAADLEKELMKRSGQSTGQRYANYIIGELTKAGGKEIHKNPYRYSNVTGSVERATFKGKLLVQMPNDSPVLYSKYLIQWHHLDGADGYKLEILNDFDEVAKVIETKDTAVVVDINIPELEDFGMAKMRVVSANNDKIESNFFALTRPEDDMLDKVQSELKALALPEEITAMDKMLLAQVLENNEFIVDAMKAYEEAIDMEPEFEPFRIAYQQFLIRVGLAPDQLEAQSE